MDLLILVLVEYLVVHFNLNQIMILNWIFSNFNMVYYFLYFYYLYNLCYLYNLYYYLFFVNVSRVLFIIFGSIGLIFIIGFINLLHSVIEYLFPILRLQLPHIGFRLSISNVPPFDSGISCPVWNENTFIL